MDQSTMQLQVDLGDLFIKKVSPSNNRRNHGTGDEMGNGDEPAWSIFKGRLRLDGNSYGNAGFSRQQMADIPRNGENLIAGSSNRPANPELKKIEWTTNAYTDYALNVFDPKKFFQKNPTAPNLAADIAISGVVYWEVDNNKEEDKSTIPGLGMGTYWEKGGKDSGVGVRRELVDLTMNWLASATNEFAKSLVIPFNYSSYIKAPKGSLAKWGQSFGAGLSGAINKLKGDAGGTVAGILKNRFNDYIGSVIKDRGNVDRITGVHLMVLIPVTTEFYSNLQELKRVGKLPGDPFPNDELTTTIPMFDSGAYNRTSTWLTFGFVPNGHPSTLPGPNSAYASGPASSFFQKQVGANKELLSFRGGYDSALNKGRGWTPDSEEWTAATPGIKAGPNIFSNVAPNNINILPTWATNL